MYSTRLATQVLATMVRFLWEPRVLWRILQLFCARRRVSSYCVLCKSIEEISYIFPSAFSFPDVAILM